MSESGMHDRALGPTTQTHQVGNDEPDEADQAADGDRCSGHHDAAPSRISRSRRTFSPGAPLSPRPATARSAAARAGSDRADDDQRRGDGQLRPRRREAAQEIEEDLAQLRARRYMAIDRPAASSEPTA